MVSIGLLTYLSARITEVSRHLARVLNASERILVGGTSAGPDALAAEDVSVEQFAELLQSGSLFSWSPPLNDHADQAIRSRLLRLVLNGWHSALAFGPNVRPDVLALTLRALTNPRHPHAQHVVRYCITAKLRQLYGVTNRSEEMEDLRKAHELLKLQIWTRSPSDTSRVEGLNRFAELLIDLFCMQERVRRHASADVHTAYLSDFETNELGIIASDSKRRAHWLRNSIPLPSSAPRDFGSVSNDVFGQPTLVPGLDLVTGGLLAPLPFTNRPSNGLINLVSGPPGSGKTTLVAALGYRMSEMGSEVRYLAVEEDFLAIMVKVARTGSMTDWLEPWILADVVKSHRGRVKEVRQADKFQSIVGIADKLLSERQAEMDRLGAESHNRDGFRHPFPLVLIIDSVTALLGDASGSASSDLREPKESDRRLQAVSRADLGSALKKLRDSGVCIFMTAAADADNSRALSYLVDNHFALSNDTLKGDEWPSRAITVMKTRHQQSLRGRHGVRLSGAAGISISPSVPSLLDVWRGLHEREPSAARRRVLWSVSGDAARPIDWQTSTPAIRDGSALMLYGRGSAGKSTFAMMIALEPAVRTAPDELFRNYLDGRAKGATDHQLVNDESAARTHILVVSFLMPEATYRREAECFIRRRFGVDHHVAAHRAKAQVDVIALEAGSLEPEALVNLVRGRFATAMLDGRPITAVVLDGVHNILVQFPLLERERVLLPALFTLCKLHGVTVITTFSLFSLFGLRSTEAAKAEDEGKGLPEAAIMLHEGKRVGDQLDISQQLAFHVLISSSNYSFLIERPLLHRDAPHFGNVQVEMVHSFDGAPPGAVGCWWDPSTTRVVEAS